MSNSSFTTANVINTTLTTLQMMVTTAIPNISSSVTNTSLCNNFPVNGTAGNGSLCTTQSPPPPAASDWQLAEHVKILLCVVYSGIFLVGVLGNLMVFYSVGYKKKRRTSNDIFLLSLAWADFIGSIFVPFVMVSDLVSGYSSYYGDIGCSVLPSISPITMAASSWSLVAIAVDRFKMIKAPLKAKTNPVLVTFGLFLVWGTSIATSLPYAMALKMTDGICWDTYSSTREQLNVFLIFTIVNWPIPLLVMIIAYALSARELKRSMGVHANNAAIAQRIKQNERIIKMFIIIMAVFFILTTPYATFMVVYNVMNDMYPHKINMIEILSANYSLTCITALNSCVNPIIYAKMHNEIRKQFSGILRCLFGKCGSCGNQLNPSVSKAYMISYTSSVSLPMSTCSTDVR